MAKPRRLISIETSATTLQEPARASSLQIAPLRNEHADEVLRFLATKMIDNVYMTGLIRDNGVEHQHNRGTFYAARSAGGHLEGVALIGHAILLEARTRRALSAFARLARRNRHAHVIVGEPEKIESFWQHYADGGQQPRVVCRELLFEQRLPIVARESVAELRRATLDDLALIVPVNASMAEEESGVNPLVADADGFRARLRRRIEQGRVWVWTEGEHLLFKVDVMTETPSVIYLEGVYVQPQERGRGLGARCLSQLGRQLLSGDRTACLLVNERNKEAQRFFFKAGYKVRGCYETIFLQPKS